VSLANTQLKLCMLFRLLRCAFNVPGTLKSIGRNARIAEFVLHSQAVWFTAHGLISAHCRLLISVKMSSSEGEITALCMWAEEEKKGKEGTTIVGS